MIIKLGKNDKLINTDQIALIEDDYGNRTVITLSNGNKVVIRDCKPKEIYKIINKRFEEIAKLTKHKNVYKIN